MYELYSKIYITKRSPYIIYYTNNKDQAPVFIIILKSFELLLLPFLIEDDGPNHTNRIVYDVVVNLYYVL